MVKKIISGGQSGADEGGVSAGKICGLETGGHMPKGFLTENGGKPEFAELYGMIEHSSELYPPRTILNVGHSQGTIRFAADFQSKGEKLTLRAIKDFKRPYIDVKVTAPIAVDDVVAWIQANNIETLNVAGNRETTWPGIKAFVENFMCEVIRKLQALNTI